MPEIIVPSTMVSLLVAFEPCFSAPSSRTFGLLVAGWIHCLGRRTITAVAVASGGVERCHISVFHRFFSRAQLESGRRGPGGLPAGAALDPGRPATARPGRRYPGTQDRHRDQPGDDAPRPVAVDRAQAVLQLRACLGGAGAVGAAADGWQPWLRVAAAVPPVRRGQARGDQGCAGPTASGDPAAGGRARACRSSAPDQAGVGP